MMKTMLVVNDIKVVTLVLVDNVFVW